MSTPGRITVFVKGKRLGKAMVKQEEKAESDAHAPTQ